MLLVQYAFVLGHFGLKTSFFFSGLSSLELLFFALKLVTLILMNNDPN